jgi:hypothetical protein
MTKLIAGAGPDGARLEAESGLFRISDLDESGNRFIVTLESDGQDAPPAPGETHRSDREGA